MFDLMFAVALSGVRVAEAAEQPQLALIDYNLTARLRAAPATDWRSLAREDFSTEGKRDCPAVFQRELPGFGMLKLTPVCDFEREE